MEPEDLSDLAVWLEDNEVTAAHVHCVRPANHVPDCLCLITGEPVYLAINYDETAD